MKNLLYAEGGKVLLYKKFLKQMLYLGGLFLLSFLLILIAVLHNVRDAREIDGIYTIFIWSGLVLCVAFGLLFARYIHHFKTKVVNPLEKSLAVLTRNGIALTEEDSEAEVILNALNKVDRILTNDQIRQKIYPFWNSVFNEDEVLTGSLKLFGEAGQILSGAFYRYDSFTDKLVLQASYAFPEGGQKVLTYGQGPIGEAAAQNKTVFIRDPEMSITVGLGTIKPSLVGCYPVCTQKMYGVVVFAFPANTSEELLRTMGIFAAQLGIVLDRVRQLEDLKKMAQELNKKTNSLNRELKYKDSILKSSADGIIILTTDGTITSFSRGAEEITGFTAEEVVGKRCCEVMQHHSRDFDSLCGTFLCVICQAAKEKQSVTGKEIYLVHKDGHYVPVLLSATPILDEAGNVLEILQIFKDLTEIKHNLTQLEQASRSKSEFLATMSHELRTPLNAVLGFAELLETETFGPLNEKQKRFTANILTAGKHLLSLINDILDISRVEAGKMEWEQELIDLPTLFNGAVNLLREKAAQSGLKIQLDIDPGVGKFVGDERKLKQITYNLLSNAVKFTPAGGQLGIIVKKENSLLEVEVWDTGIGIPKEKREAVFEPFYQVDNYLTRKHQGSGLGLALVKKMVQLAGGRIWIEEAPGKSTVFKFIIPEQPTLFTAVSEERVQAGRSLVAAVKSEKVCVLIEDDRSTAELLETYLTELGLTVVWAADGEDGIKLIETRKPELIVLDILLPGISGWDVLLRIKSTPQICAIPVLVVSILEEKKKGLALGARDYLVKPVDKMMLNHCLDRILKLRERKFVALVIDDDSGAVELMDNYLKSIDFDVISTFDAREGLKRAKQIKPDIIFLDLLLPGMDGFEFLKAKEENEAIVAIPVVVVTSKNLTPEERRFLEERTLYIARKSEFGKESFINNVLRLMEEGEAVAHRLSS